jgi:hypothetical protein
MANPTTAPGKPTLAFLEVKARALIGRTHTLRQLTPRSVGLRIKDRPFAPSPAHFAAANRRLAQIDQQVRARIAQLPSTMAASGRTAEDRLQSIAMVERELDRLRRAFGLFFEVFAQRGTMFAAALAAHDVIARDCYEAVRQAAPQLFHGALVKPLTYMEHGYSPATMRRGVTLARLLGERNPFPLIRIPYDRDQPWQAVFLHEVAHNLQADLGLWVENRDAVLQRLAERRTKPLAISIYGRWHKEIFADLASLLLGGPAVAWGLAEFLAHPTAKVMTYRPGGPHPTGYLRTLILAEMLVQMGFAEDGRRLAGVWRELYRPSRGHRIPTALLEEAPKVIPAVVDEIAFQPRRALAERTLATILPFNRDDQARIRRIGLALAQGRPATGLPPRHLVCAARYAIEAGADLDHLHRTLLARLTPVPAASTPSTTQTVRPGPSRKPLTVAA